MIRWNYSRLFWNFFLELASFLLNYGVCRGGEKDGHPYCDFFSHVVLAVLKYIFNTVKSECETRRM